MALPRRRLVVGAVGVASLLCVYILCINLEGPLPWSMEPMGRLRGHAPGTTSSSGCSEGPVDLGGDPGAHDNTTPAAAAAAAAEGPEPHTPANTAESTFKTPTSPNPSEELTRTSTRGPTPPQTRGPTLEGPPGTRGPTVQQQQQQQQEAPRPTEDPFIGDTYLSEDVQPQTNCTDGIRSRVSESEFGSRFLSGVPVLQWAGHLSPEQHQRLRQYPGTHGWGGVDYNTLMDTLSVLNTSANQQLLDDWGGRKGAGQCITCAVVGNGGILKDSGKGAEIDAHHYVFRTNGAVTRGFQADVGGRTTHYTFSTNTLINSLRSYAAAGYTGPPRSQETRYVFLPDHDRDYLMMKAAATHTLVERGPERGTDPTKFFGADVSVEKLKMYHPDFIRYLRNRFLRSGALKSKYKDIYRPSTGAVMLLAALHTCDQVSAYGFMTPDFGKFSDHYFDSSFRPVGFFINHDLRLELALWQQLHRDKLIRLYMRHDRK